MKMQIEREDLECKRVVTIAFESDKLTEMIWQKKHDVTQAFRTLNSAVQALKDGYQFNDDTAFERIETLEKSLIILDEEIRPILKTLYST